ncbi:uncharacterized protein LOC111038926 [Myzus persicae]|uniref:uncharacterized protein LOC111038926 n=1 Tax=Myzus persicae TaxID=13164 RepID=UPI000B933239|nr:uncharacterized protein LOC111038926 [Myzus persicae]
MITPRHCPTLNRSVAVYKRFPRSRFRHNTSFCDELFFVFTLTLKNQPPKTKNGRRKSIHEHRRRRTSPICQGHQIGRQSHSSHQPIDELLIHEVHTLQNSKMP